MATTDQVPQLVRDLYDIVERLEALFPGRKFTPDGHLIGSIGEALAGSVYDLTLLPPSTETHDAQAPDGRLVQIKMTQTTRVGLSSEPDFLLVLSLMKSGEFEEVYSGPGRLPWNEAGAMQKNGQKAISLAKLRRLMDDVQPQDRIGHGRHGRGDRGTT